ncbi:MAG: NAD(P)-binding domain-containing protein, partial [Aquincola sp.]|nr:NAD(P)-binding domain-containing protein [Aquincola sp.]
MRVGFLGTGEITAAMVRGLQGQGHSILVSPRNAVMAATLAAEVPDLTVAPNDEVVAGSDVVFLCLLAPVAFKVLSTLPFRADHTVIR